MIDCPSIININRLIDIDCHRFSSIAIDYRFHRLFRSWFKAVSMVGFLLKKANLSTPHRPSTCAAMFLFVDAASLWRAEIVKASLPEVNQFTGNCFRMVRIVLKITFWGLRYPGQRPECPSLSYYGSW